MRVGTTKSQGKKHSLDKFYTASAVARECIAEVGTGFDVIIEPSAGNGTFSNLLDGCLAFDIHPEADGIKEQDWFQYSRERAEGESLLVIGNPPFGQQNTLALGFINHAANFADTVAFILPISFMKTSVQNKVSRNLHLVSSRILPLGSFLLDGEIYNVPSAFQVWEHRAETRKSVPSLMTNSLFDYTRNISQADFRIQRVGGRAGAADENTLASTQSNYFAVVKEPHTVEEVLAILAQVDVAERNYGVGPRSISKPELNAAIEAYLLSEEK